MIFGQLTAFGLWNLKKRETFPSLLNIQGGDICVIPTHLVYSTILIYLLPSNNVMLEVYFCIIQFFVAL